MALTLVEGFLVDLILRWARPYDLAVRVLVRRENEHGTAQPGQPWFCGLILLVVVPVARSSVAEPDLRNAACHVRARGFLSSRKVGTRRGGGVHCVCIGTFDQ